MLGARGYGDARGGHGAPRGLRERPPGATFLSVRRLFLLGFAASLGALVVGLSSCSAALTENRREQSSGHVGCAPRDVTITAERDNSWTAECAGAKYYCSVTASEQVACKLSVK